MPLAASCRRTRVAPARCPEEGAAIRRCGPYTWPGSALPQRPPPTNGPARVQALGGGRVRATLPGCLARLPAPWELWSGAGRGSRRVGGSENYVSQDAARRRGGRGFERRSPARGEAASTAEGVREAAAAGAGVRAGRLRLARRALGPCPQTDVGQGKGGDSADRPEAGKMVTKKERGEGRGPSGPRDPRPAEPRQACRAPVQVVTIRRAGRGSALARDSQDAGRPRQRPDPHPGPALTLHLAPTAEAAIRPGCQEPPAGLRPQLSGCKTPRAWDLPFPPLTPDPSGRPARRDPPRPRPSRPR